MSLETDLLIDRRRLKRRLVFWRIVAVLALLGCVLIGIGPVATVLAGPHVARLTVSGIITDDRDLVRRVEAVATDDAARALVVDIDSPGGSVAGGEALHDAIAEVAGRKPVAALMRGTAASAGYMIAVPAQRIFARDATLTGSIGVLLQTGEVSGLLGKLGITAETIVSGPLKDQPSVTAPLSDQGRAVLQGIVMDLYDQFVGMVAAGRHMDAAAVRKLADGRAYTGRQALALGLVDQIGSDAAVRQWLATQGVPTSLPLRDLQGRGWTVRLAGGPARGWLGVALQAVAKTFFGQGVTLDTAWAVWQP
jgi:protease-4